MKRGLVIGMIVMGVIVIIFFLITISLTIYKESKIKGIIPGETKEIEVKKILGEVLYEGKYTKTISSEEFEGIKNKYLKELNESKSKKGRACDVITHECFSRGEIITKKFNKDHKGLIRCFEIFPNTQYITIKNYNGNPSLFFLRLEDRFVILSNDQDVVCSISRYGL